MTNNERFREVLAEQYRQLFCLQEYSMAAARYSPEQMADKFATGIPAGTAMFDGEGVKRACKELGIANTRKAITNYLTV